MRTNFSLFAFTVVAFVLFGCADKPSEEQIANKILSGYVCGEGASISDLKILRTEETESTDGPHVFTYTVRGEIEWPEGCATMGTPIPAGTKEKLEKKISLSKTADGWQ